MKLDQEQERAIADCLNLANRVVAVTGPAGSGKTSIIRYVAEQLAEREVPFAIAAPTGKAARRIREATGFHASTIHRLLQYPRPDEIDERTGKALSPTFPRRNATNPLDQRVLLVDEYAMVSWDLHHAIVNALPNGGSLRVFGDEAQLAPIEPKTRVAFESPFASLLRVHSAHTLEHIYRQGEGSQVLASATKIRRGQMPQHLPGAAITQTDDPLRALNLMLDKGLLHGYNKIERQLISPVRRGPIGTHELNTMLQGRFNPNPPRTFTLPRNKWDEHITVKVAVGDKVVCTENTYDLRDWVHRYERWTPEKPESPNEGRPWSEWSTWKSDCRPVQSSFIEPPENKQMLNGETGIITAIREDGSLEIDFGDRVVEVPILVEEFWARRGRVIPIDHRRAIDLAYALTTHKCQGSEFDHVLYVMGGQTWFNLSRRNLYTAVTRAKKDFVILTDQRSLLRSLQAER